MTLLITFLGDVFMPTAALAITGHESMPEYRSFEPVATTNMVNLFDGSFTYNIPLMNVPNGYPINLSYHSNEITPEGMASMVGFGWNINPGTINRVKRGFPDEWKDKKVRYHNRMPANWTLATSVDVQPELFGDESLVDVSLGTSIRYNNYTGIGTAVTGGIGFAGVANLNLSYSQGQFGFSPSINPAKLLNRETYRSRKKRSTGEQQVELTKEEKQEEKRKNRAGAVRKEIIQKYIAAAKGPGKPQVGMSFGGFGTRAFGRGSAYNITANAPRSFPTTLAEYNGFMGTLKLDFGVNLISLPMDIEGSVSGTFTRQKNVEESDKTVYGYMYNELAQEDKFSMMDYFTEAEKVFQKRDNMLGYPLPNNDIYAVSGEAMSGTFRMFRPEYGHYRKNFVKSDEVSVSLGADVTIASVVVMPPNPYYVGNTETTVGGDISGNYHWTTVGSWKKPGDAINYGFLGSADYRNSSEKTFWRFSGDKAGYFGLSNNDNAFKAGLNNTTGINAVGGFFGGATPNMNGWGGASQHLDARNQGKQKKRSTFVLHHFNSDFTVTGKEGVRYKVFDKNAGYVTPSGLARQYKHWEYDADAIGEMVTYNEDGVTYVYGLPVYARHQTDLRYSLDPGQIDVNQFNDPYDGGGLIASVTGSGIDANAKRKLGSEPHPSNDGSHPTSHLLTQILSPEYIDRTGDGPTPDDFGDYTKFNYVRQAGGTGNWYPYRTPYQGVSFSYGSLSDDADDMGSFSFGEKEVYYPHSIVSKTHAAIFTLEARADARGALVNASSSADQKISGNGTINPQSLRRVKRIDLYALSDCTAEGYGIWTPNAGASPIKTVHFQYDYSLCNGLPNNVNGNPNQQGKLTLKKVWFEHGGKLTSKISPYEFIYEYPTTTDADYPSVYDGLENYGNYSTTAQNPAYNPVLADRWGNYRDYYSLIGNDPNANPSTFSDHEIGNLARFYPFVPQNPDASQFDPAAWHLKRIKLPSGGEIHVQYEQRDYQYVQDKRAMVMVPLKSKESSTDWGTELGETNSEVNSKKYYLDLAKIGIDFASMSASQKEELMSDLFEPMEKEKQRMFFHFLYSLVGSQRPIYTSSTSEYIEGYARINRFGFDSDGIFFLFRDNGSVSGTTRVIDYPTPASKREIPRKVCRSFYKTQRRGKIDGGNNVLALEQAEANGTVEELAQAFGNMVQSLANDLDSKCQEFDPAMSYVRVQMPGIKAKLGGGCRVKRLLMYDHGIAGGPSSLFGQQFSYTTTDDSGNNISSGVAANEPSAGRRENALVNVIEKDQQSKFEAILFGRDMYGQEGPIGESLLPGPSIGYSKVTVESIHQGTTGTGTDVHEFHTVREYPFRALKTTLNQTFKHPVSINFNIAGVGVSYSRRAPHLTQGYVFKTYGMHGQPKRITKYAQGNTTTPMAEETYEYFKIGEQVKVMGNNMKLTTIPFERMGKESEILSEMREVDDYTVGGSLSIDQSAGGAIVLLPPAFAPPVLVPVPAQTSVTGGAFINQEILKTHVTSKIIQYPSMMKRVINKTDGVTHISENEVFDDHSGKPVVVRTYDDFEGTYLNQDFCASWQYHGMESKSKNEKLRVYPTALANSFDYNSTDKYFQFDDCQDLDKFTRGDFISAEDKSNYLFHVDHVDYGSRRLYVQVSQYSTNANPANLSADFIDIIRSGYTNELSSKMGNIMFFDPDGDVQAYEGVEALSTNNAFVAALNSALQNYSSGSYVFSLGGPFEHMNMSQYSAQAAGCTGVNLSDATVGSMTMVAETNQAGELVLRVLQFQLSDCNGGSMQVSCF